MLFDIGVPYKEIREYLYDIKYLFITHTHSDHIKLTTYRTLRKEFPKIKVIGNWEVASKVGVDIIIGDTTKLELDNRNVEVFPCVHNVACHGFIIQMNNKNIIYATDTSSLEHAPKIKYDYMFIESNHDENKLQQIMGKNKYGYDVWSSSKRHLSTQDSKAFYYMNRKSKESLWIELHKSERFY